MLEPYCVFGNGIHYTNMPPMLYEAILKAVKMMNLDFKKEIFFLSFAQNIDYGYTLEPLH